MQLRFNILYLFIFNLFIIIIITSFELEALKNILPTEQTNKKNPTNNPQLKPKSKQQIKKTKNEKVGFFLDELNALFLG